jgi:hypothetical protein
MRFLVRSFSTNSRPALRAAACGGRPRAGSDTMVTGIPTNPPCGGDPEQRRCTRPCPARLLPPPASPTLPDGVGLSSTGSCEDGYVAASDDWPTWLREAKPGTKGTTASARPVRDKKPGSPYYGHSQNEWFEITKSLVVRHPLPVPDLAGAVLRSWDAIFESTLGSGFHIRIHIFRAHGLWRSCPPRPGAPRFLGHGAGEVGVARGACSLVEHDGGLTGDHGVGGVSTVEHVSGDVLREMHGWYGPRPMARLAGGD